VDRPLERRYSNDRRLPAARPFGRLVADDPSRVETDRNARYPILDGRIEPGVI